MIAGPSFIWRLFLCLSALISGVKVAGFVHQRSTPVHHRTKLYLQEIKGRLVQIDESIEKVATDTDEKRIRLMRQLKFHLLEEKDLQRAADLSLNGFYKPRFVLNTSYMSPLEAVILSGIASILQSADRFDSWLGNYWGFRVRGGRRLRSPNLSASLDSVIIVATLPYTFASMQHKSMNGQINHSTPKDELVGIVELCLEEPTGLLYAPMPNPFKPPDKSKYQPYLCNLCIAKPYRRFGLGKVMCKICENFAVQVFNKNEIYLHVEKDNVPAQNLYKSLGYSVHDLLSPREKRKNDLTRIDFYRKVFDRQTQSVGSTGK